MVSLAKGKTHEQFLNEVKDNFGTEYSILTNYINARTKILIRHNICEEEYERRPDSVNNITCKTCSRQRYTHENIVKRIKDLVGNEYELKERYKAMERPISMYHSKCDKTWKVNLHHFINNGTRCPVCYGKNIKKDTISFKEEVNELVGNTYLVIGEYIDTHSNIIMKHNTDKCKHEFKVRPSDFLSHGNRCPKCKSSKGEGVIRDWLENNNFSFEEQKKFKGLEYKSPLSFDFYLECDSLKIAIEFDGIQHYRPVKAFGGEERFKIQKKRDSLKNEFCIKNNIKLIRIPYLKIKNVDSILAKELLDSSTTIKTALSDC